ncbi:unnamed protein product [Symbiodinium sp. CCMP2592]|nr:unnamed protein product [Symbiodinium sp. CCMP2592]
MDNTNLFLTLGATMRMTKLHKNYKGNNGVDIHYMTILHKNSTGMVILYMTILRKFHTGMVILFMTIRRKINIGLDILYMTILMYLNLRIGEIAGSRRRQMDGRGRRAPNNGEIEGLGAILLKITAGIDNLMVTIVEIKTMVAGKSGVHGRIVVAGHGMSGLTILAVVRGSLLRQLKDQLLVLQIVKFLEIAHKVSFVMGRLLTVFAQMKNSDFTLVDKANSVRGVGKNDSVNGGMVPLCVPGDVTWMKLPVDYMNDNFVLKLLLKVESNFHPKMEPYLEYLLQKIMLYNHLVLELNLGMFQRMASGNLGADSSGGVVDAPVPVQEAIDSAMGSSAPRWTRKQWEDWEDWDKAADGSVTPDGVSLMQQPGRTNTGATGDDDANMAAATPAQPSLALTLQEEQALHNAGWPLSIIADMREFCEFLEWARGEHGAGAVAWAMDSWGDSLVVGNVSAVNGCLTVPMMTMDANFLNLLSYEVTMGVGNDEGKDVVMGLEMELLVLAGIFLAMETMVAIMTVMGYDAWDETHVLDATYILVAVVPDLVPLGRDMVLGMMQLVENPGFVIFVLLYEILLVFFLLVLWRVVELEKLLGV